MPPGVLVRACSIWLARILALEIAEALMAVPIAFAWFFAFGRESHLFSGPNVLLGIALGCLMAAITRVPFNAPVSLLVLPVTFRTSLAKKHPWFVAGANFLSLVAAVALADLIEPSLGLRRMVFDVRYGSLIYALGLATFVSPLLWWRTLNREGIWGRPSLSHLRWPA